MNRQSQRVVVFAVAAVVIAALLPGAHAVAATAEGERDSHPSITISNNDQFDPAHGVRAGSGTPEDPFLISGWALPRLEIRDTSMHVVITDNTIDRLVLDWIGAGVSVRGNDVGDLRVNQNRPRTGEATGGTIADNTFGTVGQLRHFDGIFEENTISTRDAMFQFPGTRTVNFDGFNGSIFRNNVIYGWMEARLHGHHHSSSFADDDNSHYHGGTDPHTGDPAVDHSKRYHRTYIVGNTIYSNSDYALKYTDSNHVANDRTAASETDERLNDPHVHYTRVYIHGNQLVGGGLRINIFNAPDADKHPMTATGLMDIRDNEISLVYDKGLIPAFKTVHGILVEQAQDVRVNIIGNSVTGPERDEMQASLDGVLRNRTNGISLVDIDKANVLIANNAVARHVYGVSAARMSETVFWTIRNLVADGVEYDVYYNGDDVANPPHRED